MLPKLRWLHSTSIKSVGRGAGGGKRMFKEMLVVAGLNSEVLYSEAIMS